MMAVNFANIVSNRNALYIYHINMMSSIHPMLNHYLHLSLLPRQLLRKTLGNFALEHSQVSDRLRLALLFDETLAQYDLNLLRDVISVEQGLIVCVIFPRATKESACTVFRAKAAPILQPGNNMAIKWKIKTP